MAGYRNGTTRLFEPIMIHGLRESGNDMASIDVDAVSIHELQDGTITNDTSLGVSASYKYDTNGMGLRSTQQLPVDWTNFANHTFFNSAQVKTNVAFEQILNRYPFDGTQQQVEVFLDELTGFERYVYDLFPKYTNYLFFSGSAIGEGGAAGTFVTVRDMAGAAYTETSTKTDAQTILDPRLKSMTFEMHLWLPEMSSSNQIVVDKHVTLGSNDSYGYMITTEATGSVSQATATLRLMSGSSYDSLSVPLVKGEWNHIAWTWNRNPYKQIVNGYVNQALVGSTSGSVEFGDIYCPSADFIVGSGSAIVGGPGAFAPQTTLSGAIDELRVWSTIRTNEQRANFERKTVFSSDDDLLLKFSFNEPPGVGSNMVIDSSTNSLHGKVSAAGMMLGVRNLVHTDIPMWFEKPLYCPVMFPDYVALATLQNSLLSSAAIYDRINPNLITKLIPPHYLQEGQIADGLYTQQGAIVDPTQNYGDDPRSTRVGATQTLLVLLYTWAKFFDEIKLYLQAFSGLDDVGYDNNDTVPDVFLQDMASRHGITLPPLFQDSGIDQFINAENLDSDFGNSELSLRDVQNQIWRRVLINMQDFMKSKGTLHSVKSFIRSVGIDPDSNFRIREYGGPTRRTLEHTRDNKTEVSTMLDFSNGGFVSASLWDDAGLAKNEPGWPNFGDSGVLYTSASWTAETIVRFPTTMESGVSQSIYRIKLDEPTYPYEHMNLVAVKGGNTNLYLRNFSLLPMLTLSISDVDLFDGGLWHVSCGRQRNDDPTLPEHSLTNISSSYFLRVAKIVDGEIDYDNTVETSAFYDDTGYLGSNNEYNLRVGSSSFYMYSGGSNEYFCLSTADPIAATNATSRCTDFDGKAGHFRFWSKYLNQNEWYEHVRNYRSTGVVDPKTHFNFDTTATGSWERLRMDCSTDQEVIDTSGLGEITLTDFSQNNRVMTGSNFQADSNVIVPQTFRFSYLSPKFDESASSDKVRIRGFLDYDMVQSTPWAEQAPVYTIPRAEQPMDNERFSIDFSVTDALNQDIMTIFATLDEIDNAIGAPELLFSDDYPDLAVLRKNYFNKLTGQMNIKGFFEFFQWFDTNIGTFVSQLLPRKTRFLGTNFLVEDHVLSRHKMKYHFEDMYLGESNRIGLKDTILLQLITGDFKRY